MSGGKINRGGHMQRLRYQLGGCLLLAAALPYALRVTALENAALRAPLDNAFWASCLAIALGTWLFRNISTYPGLEKSSYVLPAFTLSYTAILCAIVFGRFDYNRTMLMSGYVLSVGWFMVLHTRTRRRSELRVGVLPFGDGARLQSISGVEWIALDGDPSTEPPPCDAIAADLRIDLPNAWDRKLADWALDGVPVYHVKHLEESLTGRVDLEHLSENNFGSLTPVSAFMTVKTIIDTVTAAFALAVLFVPLLCIGIAIKLNSPGPMLFRQQRIGYKGTLFTVYKLRTMSESRATSTDAREMAKTRESDVRVTSIGRILRHTRIDELPQVINILRGEMSWIGPRPEAEVLSRWYEAELPFYRYRHIVRPGITGWAQVNQGHVSELGEVRSKLHYDFYYIKNYSAWIDLLIIARTIRTVVTGFGHR